MQKPVLLMFAFLVFAVPASADEQMYLYQGGVVGAEGDLTVETESAYGTRETRLLGENAFEQALRVRVSGTDWLSIEGWAGMAFGGENRTEESTASENAAAAEPGAKEEEQSPDGQSSAFAVDLYGRILRQKKHAINLLLGAGYLYDYQQTSIPRARLIVSREWGEFDLVFSTLAEMPVNGKEEEEESAPEDDATAVESEPVEDTGPKYDKVDLIFTTAASYGVTDWSRVGAEAVLEDTEGLWEEEEAEGGAKLVTGPTVAFLFFDQMQIRANAAAVIPVTSNTQTRVPGGAANTGTGFLGRVALGYTF